MMTSPERQAWLLRAIAAEQYVDVLNAPFVDAYVRATGAKVQLMTWGANRCRTLASDLARMHDRGWLKKTRVGLGGNWQPGFPRWVNSYSLSGVGRDAFDAMTAPDKENRVFALTGSDGEVACHRCVQLGCNTTYGKGKAFLTGPGHSPFDGEAHYFCREHLDGDAVITEGVSDE